jgi:hypothetical protein
VSNAVSPEISFDVNPSRQVLENLMEMGALGPLIAAGASSPIRMHGMHRYDKSHKHH